MPLARSRHLFVLAFMLAMLALSAAVHIEKVVALRPCQLRFVQHGLLFLIAIVNAVAWWHRPGLRVNRLYCISLLLLTASGAASAIRQLWLQSNPLPLHVCPSANLLLLGKSEALLETVKMLVLGTPDCAIINWTLLDMSLPEWSLLTFAGLAVIIAAQLFQR